MGGKKTIEKTREWEKERRGKLNIGFNDLCKLLPDHDPSISLSKMEILKRAAAYIRQLQVQNEEIVKSGSSEGMKNEAERLKKRVTYLLLKTKELVDALRAAGIPIPNSNKKKSHSQKKGNPKGVTTNQNLSPPSTVTNTMQGLVLLESGEGIISGAVPEASEENCEKCNCKKKSKKTPLSEVNRVTAKETSVGATLLGNNVLVSNCHGQATILNSIQTLNVEKSLFTPTLGPGTLILRDGRLIAVPPSISIIPPILVKPQPTVIVMQRAQPAPVKREKHPVIVPKRREITQTTFANKAPIPAIKTFKMESYPKTPKSKIKKKKEDKAPDNLEVASVAASDTSDNLSVPGKDVAGTTSNFLKLSKNDLGGSARTNLKRKTESKSQKSKMPKPCVSVDEDKGNVSDCVKLLEPTSALGEAPVTVCSQTDLFNQPAKLDESDVPESSSNPLILQPNVCARSETFHELMSSVNGDHVVIKNDDSNLLALTSQGNDVQQLDCVEHTFEQSEGVTERQSSASKFSREGESGGLTDLMMSSKDGTCTTQSTKSDTPLTASSSLNSSMLSSMSTSGDINECHINDPFTGRDTDRCSGAPSSCYCPDVQVSLQEKNMLPSKLTSNESQPSTRSHGKNLDINCTEKAILSKPNLADKNITASAKLQDAASGSKITSVKPDCTIKKRSHESESSSVNALLPTASSALDASNNLPDFHKASIEKKTLPVDCAVAVDCKSLSCRPENFPNFPDTSESTRVFLFQDSALGQNMAYPHGSKVDQLMNSVTLGNSSNLVDVTSSSVDIVDPNCSSSFSLKTSIETKSQSDAGVASEGVRCNQEFACRNGNFPRKRAKVSKNQLKRSIGLVDPLTISNRPDSCDKTCQVGPSSNDLTPILSQEVAGSQPGVSSSCNKIAIDAHSSGHQPCSVPVSENCRPDNFFNYDNPIGSLPSVDPFFVNFIGKPEVASVASTASPVTSFSYSTFTSQSSPVRSVARQLFSVEPTGNIPNNYPVISNRQNEADPNAVSSLMPSSSSQIFQFGSYSTSNTLFFPNDFNSTPSKNNAPGMLESIAQNDKETFTELLHPPNTNSFSSIPTNAPIASVSSSTACFLPDSHQMTNTLPSTQCQKTFSLPDAKSTLDGSQLKQTLKPYCSEANFSMNVIASQSRPDFKDFEHNRVARSGMYNKSCYTEASQNWNFHYMPSSQSQLNQVTDVGYNVQNKDVLPSSQSQPNTNLRLCTSSSGGASVSVDHLNYSKPSFPKEFNMSADNVCVSSFDQKNNVERFDGQSNVFINNLCNQFPDLPLSKAQMGSATESHTWSNLREFATIQQTSVNQGVQTQQSYLCKLNSQGSHAAKNSSGSSGNYSVAMQSSNQSTRVMNSDRKFCKAVHDGKLTGKKSNECLNQVGPSCNQSVQTHRNYQITSNLPKTLSKSAEQNQNSLPSSYVFSYPSNISQNSAYSSSIFTSYSSISSSSSHLIYSNPTTVAASNFGYVHSSNPTVATPIQQGLNQNTLSLDQPTVANTGVRRNTPSAAAASNLFLTIQTSSNGNLDSVNKNHNTFSNLNTKQNPMTQTKLTQSSNLFGGTNANTIDKTHTSVMSNFNVNNVGNFSNENAVEGHSVVHQGSTEQPPHSSPNQNYSLQGSKQNMPVDKSNLIFQNVPNSVQTPSKSYEYPLASILTGLSDATLTNSLIPNDVLTVRRCKNSGNPEVNDKTPNSGEKIVEKHYASNNVSNVFKNAETGCSTDYLRPKESDRNPFIPIIEDVRLNSEFSNDIFSSLQVPSGGTHSDSISPTAAFLLAFPLVSNSKNAENLPESEQQDNNAATPTTILQIGNVDPPNSDLFQPLEFGKDLEPSDYLGQASDKFKRKENVSQEKPKKQLIAAGCSQSYSYSGLPNDFGTAPCDQTWSDFHSKGKPVDDPKKNEKGLKDASSSFEMSKQDRKKKNKISVNWMTAPDVNESFQKEVEASAFPSLNLPFPMDIDTFPDLCSNKKNNGGNSGNTNNIYSWSPSKTLLPLDTGLMIPSTLPTLVGDLALGTPTPSDTFNKRPDGKKNQDKSLDKRTIPQKAQNNFLSVSQLVDPKSKKQKLPEIKGKKADKKKTGLCQKRKDSAEPCMYSDNFLPSLGWDKHRYKNNYSAEALIGSQDVTESVNFPYQQNANCFPAADFAQEQISQTQQYQNNITYQNQFPPFGTEDYQGDSYNISQQQNVVPKRGQGQEKRDSQCQENSTPSLSRYSGNQTFQQPPQQYVGSTAPASSAATSLPQNFTSNTTTSVTNFNLSTIFPEINERTGTQGQQSNQTQQLGNMEQHPNSNFNSSNNFRTHNL